MYDNDFTHRVDIVACRSPAFVAIQQRVGLLPEWHIGIDPINPYRASPAGADLIGVAV